MKTRFRSALLASLITSVVAANAAALVGDAAGGGRVAAQSSADAALISSIKARLLRAPDVDALDVNVAAKDGVVTLSGSADSAAKRASAEKIARSVAGVKQVDNRIQIRTQGKPPTTPAR